MKTFKSRTSAWMILAVIGLPIAVLGAVDLVLNPAQWPTAMALIGGAMLLVGYNFTARLLIEDEYITFKRYGWVVWRTTRRGAEIGDGMAGDVPLIPAIIIRQDGRKVGFVLRGWFDEAALASLRAASLG